MVLLRLMGAAVRRSPHAVRLEGIRAYRACANTVAVAGPAAAIRCAGGRSLKRCRALAADPTAVLWRGFAADAAKPQPQQLGELIVTPSCTRRIKALQAKSGKAELKLRLTVEGGGCSGFQYNFTMDDGPINDDDKVFERDGATVVVDEGSLEFVRGATVDYVDEMMRSAFSVVNNPMSESACGCGSSFAVKNFEKNPAID